MDNMYPCIKQRNGIWYLWYSRTNRKSLQTDNQEIAEKILKAEQKRLIEEKIIKLEKGSLCLWNDFAKEYLEHRRGDKKRSTLQLDISTLNKFGNYYGNKTLAGITPKILDQFKNFILSAGLAKTSVNVHIRHLKRALKTAMKWGYISRNIDILDDLKQFKIEIAKPIYMTDEEVKRLLDVAGQYRYKEMQTAIAIMTYTGVSRAEITSQIFIGEDALSLKRVKTNKLLEIPISTGLRPYIAHLPKGLQRIIRWKNPRTFSRHFENIVKMAGLQGISPHKIRHTFATHLRKRGERIETIKELLGHSSIAITDKFYAHIEVEEKRTAVNKLSY